MKPINYGLSFIAGKWTENQVRFWVESRTRFIDDKNKIIEDYYQCGSCKSEDTFADRNLFLEDNYDFTPVFGPDYGVIFRRKSYLNDNYKTCPKAGDMWKGQTYKLKEVEHIKVLENNDAIREATHNSIPIVAQTEIYNQEEGLRAIIEYPVKTMNIHDVKNLYQTDTGPVLLPDLSRKYERVVDSIQLAFVAFNTPEFADFVIEQPTPIIKDGNELCKVYHYSKTVSLKAKNTLFAVL